MKQAGEGSYFVPRKQKADRTSAEVTKTAEKHIFNHLQLARVTSTPLKIT